MMGGSNSGKPVGCRDYEKNKKKGVCPICGEEFRGRINKIYDQPSCIGIAYYRRCKANGKNMDKTNDEQLA